MDLTGKGFSPAAHSFIQHGLVSAYGLGSSLVAGQTPLTTSMFKGSSHSLTSPIYSGSLSSSISPSHTSFSNGHNISSLHRHSSDKSPSTDTSTKSQIYASPAPVFNRHKDSFPYGISGVPMPNYNYHGDVYQFTSNGYPRKSRTCSYCGKVFTRSTTRRYHEKRCPLLRAAVSSYMGDDNSGTGSTTPLSSGRGRGGELGTHSYKGQGQSFATSQLSGMTRSNEPQELSTSVLAKSPPGDRRSGSGDSSLLSGYKTSVIVKQEQHELEALANMASSAANSLGKKHSVQSQDNMSDSVLRFSPESDDSDNKHNASANISPDPGLDLTMARSPSHTSNLVALSENYIRARYGSRMDVSDDERPLPPVSSLQDRYGLNRKAGDDDSEKMDADETQGDGIHPKDDEDQLSDNEENLDGENESVTSEKLRDGKVFGNHKCGFCGKGFESSGKLYLHEQLHTKFKPYSCKFCGQKFAKAAQRIEHEKTHNGNEVTHVCAVCGSSFTRKHSLKLHMRRWHQEGPWLCRHCGKASLTQMELKTHLYSHNLPRLERESLLYMPDIPHNYNAANSESGGEAGVVKDGNDETAAEHANEAATADQNQPVNIQSSQEMEMCQECGRDFPKGYLRYHLKSHEAQKPYSCPICAKRFGYKNNMKSHIKLHTGIKPFQCKICGAKFTRGSTLRRHARRHGIIADSVWDLFVKPNYNKTGQGGPSRNNKQDTISTSRNETKLTTSNNHTGSVVGEGGESNYLATSLSANPSHSSLYPLYASLGQLPHMGLYQGLSASTSYLAQHLPHSSVYAASSQLHPQQLDALNLSLHKGPNDHSDQSSFSNISAERSRSRSGSLSGSDTKKEKKILRTADIGVQVHLCCPSNLKETASVSGTSVKSEEQATGTPSVTPTSQLPGSPSSMAVVPYIVTSPSRPSNLDSTSPALSVSSSKDYSMETISTLIGSGRMFKCFHCECYFSEYAMYRIHSKLHINDDTHPFVCMVCGEDCHDRVYFALHLSEHLR